MKSQTHHLKGSRSRFSKKYLLLLPVLFLFVFTLLNSCRKDDDTNSEAENLVGLWQPYKLNQKATLTTGNYDQTTDFTVCQQKARIIFSKDNKGSATTYIDMNGACVQQGQSSFTYSYDVNSKILVITNPDGTTQSGTVLQLTPSDLVYELVGNYDFEGDTNVQVKSTFYARRTKD